MNSRERSGCWEIHFNDFYEVDSSIPDQVIMVNG
jgi:hypothetical protein